MIKMLDSKVLPSLRRNRYPDKQTSQRIAQVLRAVAGELEV
jgi:CspA family cold shock protein